MNASIKTIIYVLISPIMLINTGHAMPMAGPTPQQPMAMPSAVPPPTIPAPMPATMPSTVPPPTIPAPLATGTPPQPANAQELNQLNQLIEEITNTKKALKDQIKQLDDKLNEARTDVASMRKTSTEILSKAQEAEAQAILTTINTGLSKVSATQTFITGDFSRTFDSNIAKIQGLIDQGQNLIKALQAKGYQYQISQAQLQAVEEKTKATAAAKEAAAKEKLAAKKEKGFWDTITGFFATTTHRIKKFFIGIKNIFTSESKGEKVTVSAEVKKKISEPTPITMAPTVSPITQSLITSQLTEADAAIKQLEEQQKSIDQKLLSLDQSTTNFVEALKNIQPAKPATAQPTLSQEPKWKQLIMFITSEILDALAFMVTGIIYVFKTIYNYFFSGIINRFVGDVKEKIKEEETKEKLQKKGVKPKAATPQQAPEASTGGISVPTAPPSTMPGSMPTPPTTPEPPSMGGMPGMATQPPPVAPAPMGGMPGMPMA